MVLDGNETAPALFPLQQYLADKRIVKFQICEQLFSNFIAAEGNKWKNGLSLLHRDYTNRR
jgi:hypothetical protein